MSTIYNWHRYWYPRDIKESPGFDFFFADPTQEWFGENYPGVVELESLLNIPCLILLGEPGIGKTFEINRIKSHLENSPQNSKSFLINLRSIGSYKDLEERIFKRDIFTNWIDSNYNLTIFLDSFDEGLLSVKNLSGKISDCFKDNLEERKEWLSRLRLIITSRPAEWSFSLENDLKELWGEDSVKVYQLLHLRRDDVIESSEKERISPASFLNEAGRLNVVPMLRKPITLNIMMKNYKESGKLPGTQNELYLDECRRLCKEPDERRRDNSSLNVLNDNSKILATASRIAALTVFCNKNAVWNDLDLGNIPLNDLPICKICGGKEITDTENEFEIDENVVRQTLRTGLFTSGWQKEMMWAHQSYAEFLAAHYLVKNNFSLEQMINLLVHPEDSERKIIPQLREVAAWLAGMNEEILKFIIEVEPDLILRGDLSTLNDDERSKFTDALLQYYNSEKSRNDLPSLFKLKHPGLAGQLRIYLNDKSRNFLARRLSIDIVRECKLEELFPDIVKIALDQEDDMYLRIDSAYTISKIGDNDSRLSLKPLAFSQVGDDPDDELKGYGLRALWPGNINATELFGVLNRPKRTSLYGGYMSFLNSHFLVHLENNDLFMALNWIENQNLIYKTISFIDDVIDEILWRSWRNIESPGITESFVRILIAKRKKYIKLFNDDEYNRRFEEELISSTDKRQYLITAVFNQIEEPLIEWKILIHADPPLVIESDINWLLERLIKSGDQDEQKLWAICIEDRFNRNDFKVIDTLFYASQENNILEEELKEYFVAINLDSDEAKQKRDSDNWWINWNKERNEKKQRMILSPSPQERIINRLDQFESGDFDAWWQLSLEMTLEPESIAYGYGTECDITTCPGWENTSIENRERIIRAAEHLIIDHNIEDDWLKQYINENKYNGSV